MKTSQAGLEFIAKWEGCILKPYKDVAGLRTIGIGHLIVAGENYPDDVEITLDEAYKILAADVEKCERGISDHITVDLNQNQFDALVSFGFNCGVGVYAKSTACVKLNAGDYDSFPQELMAWSKAKIDGVLTVVPGLAARRDAEGKLFSKPVFEDGFIEWNKQNLLEVQTNLSRLGLYNKSIDGIWGPGTKQAVISFASQAGISLEHDVSYGIPYELLENLKNS